MKIDFIGVGFGRSGSKWLVNCLYEHPDISIPKFNLHTEINYFPEEYKIMGIKNYEKKFRKCDFEKVVGEISTLIIFHKDSAKLLKKTFPDTKIIIYKRKESERAKSAHRIAKYYDLVEDERISSNPVKKIKQDEYIRPFLDEFGKKRVFIFDMDKKDKQKELNRLFKFLGVKNFSPPSLNKKFNQSYKDAKRKEVLRVKRPFVRKLINKIKPFIRKRKKLFYFMKRNLKLDYYYQAINHNL